MRGVPGSAGAEGGEDSARSIAEEEDAWLGGDGGGESQSKEHTGRVGAERAVEVFTDLGESLNLPLHFGAVAAPSGADSVEEAQVLAPGECRGEAAREVEECEHAAANRHHAGGWLQDSCGQVEQR